MLARRATALLYCAAETRSLSPLPSALRTECVHWSLGLCQVHPASGRACLDLTSYEGRSRGAPFKQTLFSYLSSNTCPLVDASCPASPLECSPLHTAPAPHPKQTHPPSCSLLHTAPVPQPQQTHPPSCSPEQILPSTQPATAPVRCALSAMRTHLAAVSCAQHPSPTWLQVPTSVPAPHPQQAHPLTWLQVPPSVPAPHPQQAHPLTWLQPFAHRARRGHRQPRNVDMQGCYSRSIVSGSQHAQHGVLKANLLRMENVCKMGARGLNTFRRGGVGLGDRSLRLGSASIAMVYLMGHARLRAIPCQRQLGG